MNDDLSPRIAHRRRNAHAGRRRVIATVASIVALLLIAAGGYAAYAYFDLQSGIHRSKIAMPTGTAPGIAQNTGETNILIMGLDSRVDQNGKPLPQDIYDAIHAGDQSDGGYNANVLMFVHIPAGGGKAVGISIPRDDYAALSGSPDGVSHSKIKEAYGLALDEKERELLDKGVAKADAYQQARAYARQTEIQTVSDFLGGVRIDHFIEITMAAFYKIAQAVQPITVCLNHSTIDAYSGADFPAGMQQISASQAMSFVRQRRDTGTAGFDLTDLDRTRRQQAFIVSLAVKLRKADTFTNFGTLQSLIDTAKQYVALDDGFDLLSFAGQAQKLAGGNITFQTLPVQSFGQIDGKDVNIVDLPAIQQQVHDLLNPPTATPAASGAPATGGAGAGSGSGSGEAGSAAPAPPTASDAATPGATPTPSNVYTDSQSPLQAGTVPCVN